MAFVAGNPEHFLHRKVGTGESVDFVKAAATVPGTGTWKQGNQVMWSGAGVITKGTVIATFEGGEFPTYHGTANHVAIYLSHDPNGIRVLDQYVGRAVGERHIGLWDISIPRDNATAFYVVE